MRGDMIMPNLLVFSIFSLVRRLKIMKRVKKAQKNQNGWTKRVPKKPANLPSNAILTKLSIIVLNKTIIYNIITPCQNDIGIFSTLWIRVFIIIYKIS